MSVMRTARAPPAGCLPEAPASHPPPCRRPLPLTLDVAGTTRHRRDARHGSPAGCGCYKTAGSGATGRATYAPGNGLRLDRMPRLVEGGRQKGCQGAQALALPSCCPGLRPRTYLRSRRPRSPHSCPGQEARGPGWATSQRPRTLWAAPPLGPALSVKQGSLRLPLPGSTLQGPVGIGGPPRVQGLLWFHLEHSCCGGIPAVSTSAQGEDPDTIRGLLGVRWGRPVLFYR